MKNQLKVLNKKESSLRTLLSFFTETEINDEDTNPFNYYRNNAQSNEDLETINALEKSYQEIIKIENEFFGEPIRPKKTITKKSVREVKIRKKV